MLRRLMKESLHMSDLRMYRYPRDMAPTDVLAISKKALGSKDIQLVQEYITETPTFDAEVWYYAEIRGRGYKVVIRLGVIEEKGLVELFAASTAMQPIIGLLTDIRHDLDIVLQEGYAEEARMDPVHDEKLRRYLERRSLHLDDAQD
jgi:hypothetical protein